MRDGFGHAIVNPNCECLRYSGNERRPQVLIKFNESKAAVLNEMLKRKCKHAANLFDHCDQWDWNF
jgi:hypothetical protein